MKVLNRIDIVPRHDTLENFLKVNPILREKELCCVLMPRGKCRWKLGDGKTPFKKLRYVRKISEIQEMILYNSTLTSSTNPVHITTRNTVVYFNPFTYNTENNNGDKEHPEVVSKSQIIEIFKNTITKHGKGSIKNESENNNQTTNEN